MTCFYPNKKYATEILEWAKMLHCKPARTPVNTLTKFNGTIPPISYSPFYRILAGALHYLTFIRPHIMYVVQQVCLFMHDPWEHHFTTLKRILRYVNGSLDHDLQVYTSPSHGLVAYSNVDWTGYPTNRQSTSGYCVFLGQNLLLWSSKSQGAISCSNIEVEYQGVMNVVVETWWLYNLLCELCYPSFSATLFFNDNVSAVYLSFNPA